ncbi:hypothetical protein F7725_009674 [Dissostichus mawsoni]|uniref:Uncharacterized protein n=1 Tax=Dissostichus mawsoni TaxID=36200 RepID=A0A7J5XLC4_DISMA|nr:hypothetical protein F7725_009674 [Dissostichus mawsoni]
MKAEIWAGLLHGMSTDDSTLHTRCNPSWCWYRKAEDNGETPGSHKQHAGNFLKREVGEKLIPKLWLQSTAVTVSAMRQTDLLRISKAEAVTSASLKYRRKSLSTAKKVKRHQQEMQEGPTYGAGMD